MIEILLTVKAYYLALVDNFHRRRLFKVIKNCYVTDRRRALYITIADRRRGLYITIADRRRALYITIADRRQDLYITIAGRRRGLYITIADRRRGLNITIADRRRGLNIFIIIIKRDWQCKAGRERSTPYQSEDPNPTTPTLERKKRKGKQ